MLDVLRTHDPQLLELKSGRGSVLIPPSLNGRIFCQFDGVLVHRLDGTALQNPSPTEYDNLGGNSLWPAPEGGAFAFNYLPGSDQWLVQDGISKVIPSVSRIGDNEALVEKRIHLTNRKNAHLVLDYRRVVSVPDKMTLLDGYELEGFCYYTEDIFEPLNECRVDDVLMAPWSLEQFPGADGIVAFGKVADAQNAINFDFYDDPGERISWRQGCFTFHLGGKVRHQIGINVQSQPQYIGALDIRHSMLFLRQTPPQQGIYFNIADNEQSKGALSATDMYSIFNGGELGFFELETIGAMNVIDGRVSLSNLPSRTLILKGKLSELLRYLSEQEDLLLDKSIINTLA